MAAKNQTPLDLPSKYSCSRKVLDHFIFEKGKIMKNVVAALALGFATSVFAADAAKTPAPPVLPAPPAKAEAKKEVKKDAKKAEKKEVKKEEKKAEAKK